MALPCIGFFPALPLANNLKFGEWMVGNPPPETYWASERFKEISTLLIDSFKKRKLSGGAMLWHRTRGFDGSRPNGDEALAIVAAVAFSVLDANDRIPRDLRGGQFASLENAELFLQPLDDSGRIVSGDGGLVRRKTIINWPIGDEPPPFADSVLPLDEPVRVSAKLATAFYAATLSNQGPGPAIRVAAEWHRSAFANPTALTFQQRIIALKIGFEALFHGDDPDDARECARLLRTRLEEATAAHHHLLPWIGLLWSPKEKINLQRTWKGKADERSELEDWFLELNKVRNKIIHEGTLTARGYLPPTERPLSRYAGSFLWVGERVLREAIKATLGPEVLLCGAIRNHAIREQAMQGLQQYAATIQPPGVAAPSPLPAPAPTTRSVPDLLAELGFAAANEVILTGVAGDFGARRITPRGVDDSWDLGDVEIDLSITEDERDALLQAGAEDDLWEPWYACE
jgi:hypothetical protein